MKIFITGGTGFIGSHLIEYLLKKHRNAQIYALVRNRNNLKWLEGLPLQFMEGTLFSIPSLPPDLDCVIHIAGLTKSNKLADYYTVNHKGTASVFDHLLREKINPKKIVLLSSYAACGPSSNGKPVKENDPPKPVSPYGISKLLGEQEALKFKDVFPLTILRVGAVFGPRDRDVLSYFKFIKRRILPSLNSQHRLFSLCYVKDLARAVDLCFEKNIQSGEIINIADSTPYSWDELGRAAGNALGTRPIRIRIPLPIVFLAALASEAIGRISHNPSIINLIKFKEMKQKGWVASTEKAEKILGFHSKYSLQEAVVETVAWYKEKGWL